MEREREVAICGGCGCAVQLQPHPPVDVGSRGCQWDGTGAPGVLRWTAR